MTQETQSALKRAASATFLFLWEVAKVVVIVFAIILPVRQYLIKPFYVRGASMEPNFHDYEYLVIDELSYHLRAPERGEVVVLKDPSHSGQFFIKRIIGLPGEHVTVRDGKVSINGEVLDESLYLEHTVRTNGLDDVTLGDHEYYVLGDNRSASLDSRVFGPLADDEFIGRTWIRAWPPSRLHLFSSITYPE